MKITRSVEEKNLLDSYNFVPPAEVGSLSNLNRLTGLVVKASALRAEDPVFETRLGQDFSRSNYTSDLKIGAPVATLTGAWCY